MAIDLSGGLDVSSVVSMKSSEVTKYNCTCGTSVKSVNGENEKIGLFGPGEPGSVSVHGAPTGGCKEAT